jgi:integrase
LIRKIRPLSDPFFQSLKMNVNFNLRNPSKEISSIYLVVNFRNFRVKLGTGISIKTKFWNQKIQRSRDHYSYPDAQFINAHLERISSEVLESFYAKQTRKHSISREDIKNSLKAIILGQTLDIRPKGFWEYFDSFIADKEGIVRRDVFKDYTYSLRKHLKTAEKKVSYSISFDVFRLQENGFAKVFEDYLRFDAVGIDGRPGLAINTVGKNIKNLKSFLNWCFDREITPRFPLKHLVTCTEEPETVYLTESEIERLEKLPLESIVEKKVRDNFLFACETGLRFGDLKKLKPHHLNDGNLKITQSKTQKPVTIPLSDRVLRVLFRNDGFLPPYENSVTQYNKVLRLVAEKADINDMIVREVFKAGGSYTRINKKFELISSHTARRSFCTNKFLKEMPAQAIMQFSGHKSERSFLRYLRIDSELAAVKYREFF